MSGGKCPTFLQRPARVDVLICAREGMECEDPYSDTGDAERTIQLLL